MILTSICLCLPSFLSSLLCSFLSTGLLPPRLGLFLGILLLLLLYQMGFSPLISVSDTSLLVYKNAFELWILTLYQAVLPNSFIRLSSFLWTVYDFLCTVSCHLQTMTVLFPLFQFGCLLFHFLVWLLWLQLPILCWIEVVEVDNLVLFLILVGEFNFYFFKFLKFWLLFNYSCLPFLPIPPPHPRWTHLPPPPPPSRLILSICPL